MLLGCSGTSTIVHRAAVERIGARTRSLQVVQTLKGLDIIIIIMLSIKVIRRSYRSS